MLERLHVRNFRRLNDLRIDGLRRINLIAGRNNAGKTSLLEAIFLLSGAGNPRLAINHNLTGITDPDAMPASIWETLWTPLFFGLETEKTIQISGRSSSAGDVSLTIALERPVTTEIPRNKDSGALLKERFGESVLKFTYTDPEGTVESQARETAENIAFDGQDRRLAFPCGIRKPTSGDVKQDAILLGQLRKQKRGDLVRDTLRVIEPELESVEDNSSSGQPLIWADVGMRELVPLPVLGAGMTHLARIVLSSAAVQGGVLLVDEVENGLHHGVLPDAWRVLEKAVREFDVQVFATTHSFECVEAAHGVLGADGFRLHRLEVVDGTNHCVTYSDDAMDGAVRHHMEVR